MRTGKINVGFTAKVIIFFFAVVLTSQTYREAASPPNPPLNYAPDRIIIKLKAGVDRAISITHDVNNHLVTGLASLDELNIKYGATKMDRLIGRLEINSSTSSYPSAVDKKLQSLSRIFTLNLEDGINIPDAVSEYQNDPAVEYAEPDYIANANLTIPNDSYFVQQSLWGLHNVGQSGGTADADIDAPEAWDIATGSREVIVAVVDTGVQYTHPDLAANMWTNPGEIPNNGKDDDGNGYIDDVYGINAKINNGYAYDNHGHGTHVAGTIGGVGNNSTGVVGVNWQVSIMALKFMGSNNWGYYSDAVECIVYGISKGVHIMNHSWGGSGYSQSLKEAVDAAEAAGILFVVAAHNQRRNIDSSPMYPASYSNVNIISVAATDRNDNLASFSNYGAVSVDVAAPGVNIYSTMLTNTYVSWSGTSMAAPHVSGLAALIMSRYGVGSFIFTDVKNHILDTVDLLPGLAGKMVTGGRINAYSALMEVNRPHINSMSPDRGLVGDPLTIYGDNLGESTGTVYFYHNVEATIISWSDTQIVCEVPQGALTGKITVVSSDGTSNGMLYGVYEYLYTYYRDNVINLSDLFLPPLPWGRGLR